MTSLCGANETLLSEDIYFISMEGSFTITYQLSNSSQETSFILYYNSISKGSTRLIGLSLQLSVINNNAPGKSHVRGRSKCRVCLNIKPV